MIHATIRMKMPGQKLGKAVEILRSMVERTRVQPGCISCRIYRDESGRRHDHDRGILEESRRA